MSDSLLKEARSRIAKYCAYRERAAKEVKQKLLDIGLDENQSQVILDELIEGGFVDDVRYAKLYAGGKFRLKKWGKLKIRRELRMREISEDDIQNALNEIEGQSYLETLETLAEKKFSSLNEENLYEKKNKVAAYLVSKGYESELVWGVLNKLN